MSETRKEASREVEGGGLCFECWEHDCDCTSEAHAECARCGVSKGGEWKRQLEQVIAASTTCWCGHYSSAHGWFRSSEGTPCGEDGCECSRFRGIIDPYLAVLHLQLDAQRERKAADALATYLENIIARFRACCIEVGNAPEYADAAVDNARGALADWREITTHPRSEDV